MSSSGGASRAGDPHGSASTPVPEGSVARSMVLRHGTARRAAVVVVGALLGAYIAVRKPTPDAAELPQASQAASENIASAALNASPEPPAPAAPAPVEAAAAAAPEPSPPPAPASEVPRSSTAVEIEVVPFDAQVVVAGVAQPGPPFVIDVPPGKRMVFEVARKGYVPRRVVVDGHEAKMTIGLLRRGGRGVEPAPAAESAAEPGEATKDSRLRVRSGL
ncbi:MAG: hypothetical protein QM749_16740 [Aquabacterium sp.]